MKKLLFLLSSIIILSCSQTPEKKLEQPVTQIKKKSSIPKKKKKKIKIGKLPYDTINHKNAIPFLKQFGRENLESIVEFQTDYGAIRIQLFKDTPFHRASMIFLIKTGYFDNTNFHRVIKDFIIQAGNSDHPLTRKFRIKYESYRVPAEIKSYRKHDYGVLAAAREWDNNPNKVSSPFEFYIIQSKEGSYHLDGEHTIFGKVISGMNVVNKIASLETDRNQWPIKDVNITAKVLK